MEKYFNKQRSQLYTIHRLNQYQPGDPHVNQYWGQFFSLLPDGMLVTRLDGVIELANPAMASLLGIPNAMLMFGKPVERYIPADFKMIFSSYLEMVSVIPGRHGPVELELWHMNGSRVVVKVSFSQFPYLGRPAIQMVIQDIQEIKLMEDQMARTTFELEQAYRATLEGWAMALDKRDQETGAHSKHVTDKTVEMALAMGIGLESIVHIRHGALLHDIGKMAIPDSILTKPAPLTEDEWVEMRKHPVIARDMLLPIDYLRPAIEIPYNHHERWNGSGYPRGLREANIPITARIFAVVDVYDALSHDRYYRRAWEHNKVLDYISDNAGVLFDPQVVQTFLDYL
jgi:PAS domain S-box-containing protein